MRKPPPPSRTSCPWRPTRRTSPTSGPRCLRDRRRRRGTRRLTDAREDTTPRPRKQQPSARAAPRAPPARCRRPACRWPSAARHVTGSLCRPSPSAMNELWNGSPSTVPRTFTSPRVPKNSADSGHTDVGPAARGSGLAAARPRTPRRGHRVDRAASRHPSEVLPCSRAGTLPAHLGSDRRAAPNSSGVGSALVQRIRGLVADTRPLRNEHFRRLWLANIITVIGAQLTVVAVPAQIYARDRLVGVRRADRPVRPGAAGRLRPVGRRARRRLRPAHAADRHDPRA